MSRTPAIRNLHYTSRGITCTCLLSPPRHGGYGASRRNPLCDSPCPPCLRGEKGLLKNSLCVFASWWFNFLALIAEERDMKNGKLRSQTWFARTGRDSFVHRAWLK